MTSRWREVSGILLLDKPQGLSSNQALQAARHLYGAAKGGHTGTLDPLATGVLPLCFGEATKVCQFLLDADKVYRARARLGEVTDTDDAEGRVLTRRPVKTDASALQAQLRVRTGTQQQVPPMYSAIKQNGQALYVLARRGEVVERAARTVHISRLELTALDWPEFEIEVHCSKGTYIRTLVADIGAALDCGAHLVALRRLAVGGFGVADAVPLDTLRGELDARGTALLDARLIPLRRALSHLACVVLPEALASKVLCGQWVSVPDAPPPGWASLQDAEGRFLGVGEVLADGRIAPRRMLNLTR